MPIDLVPIGKEEKQVLYNLYQYYEHEFSPYTNMDIGLDGRFSINLEHYWEDPRWNPFLICYDKKIAGFLIILFDNNDTDPDPIHVIYDFLILRKYRRKGIGKSAAVQAFNLYKAVWKVVQISENRPAQHFWRDVVNDYTAGQYTEIFREDINKYVQTFNNRDL